MGHLQDVMLRSDTLSLTKDHWEVDGIFAFCYKVRVRKSPHNVLGWIPQSSGHIVHEVSNTLCWKFQMIIIVWQPIPDLCGLFFCVAGDVSIRLPDSLWERLWWEQVSGPTGCPESPGAQRPGELQRVWQDFSGSGCWTANSCLQERIQRQRGQSSSHFMSKGVDGRKKSPFICCFCSLSELGQDHARREVVQEGEHFWFDLYANDLERFLVDLQWREQVQDPCGSALGFSGQHSSSHLLESLLYDQVNLSQLLKAFKYSDVGWR